MKNMKFVSIVFTILIGLQIGFSQTTGESPPTPPRAIPTTNPTPKISDTVSKSLAQFTSQTLIPREQREQAYAKLLEGQRYIWNMRPRRSQTSAENNSRLAKQALQKAVELNPALAEAYTVLAELTLSAPPHDLEEAIALAGIAVKIEPENFGGHRILARLYTIKSRLNNGILEPAWTQKAISEWKEVGRLDPRNAEAFAFLSEFYARTKMPAERIDALRKWLASAAPLDPYFYGRVMGEGFELSPESATVKYGRALLETGESREAIEVLSRAIADNPENEDAIEILRRAVETADTATAAIAVQALQQAVFANPENTSLVEILARIHLRTGKKNEALQTVRALRAKNAGDYSLLRLEATLLTDSGKVDEAVELIKASMKEKPSAKNGQGIGSGNGGTTFVLPASDEFSNFLFISNLYSQAKRGKEAAEAANQAYAMTENAERKQIAKLTLATAQQMGGDFQGAEKTLREILKQSPGNPIALNNLGYFLAERDEKLDEALKLIERAVEIDQTNPSYLDSLGWVYFKLGKLSEAEKYLKEAARIDDSSSTIHEHLGDVYRKQGKPEAAQASWRKALTLTSEADEITRIKAKLDVKISR